MSSVDIVWWAGLAKKLNLLAQLSFVVPLLCGLLRWRELPTAYRPLVWFAAVPGCLIGLLSEVGRAYFHYNVLWLHLGIVLETLVLGWAYWNVLPGAGTRRYIWAVLLLALLIFGAEPLLRGPANNGYSHVVQTLALSSFALLYFENALGQLHIVRLSRDAMFLVSVATLFYYTGTITVFLLEPGMQQAGQFLQIWLMYIVQCVLLLFFNLLLARALRLAGRYPALVR